MREAPDEVPAVVQPMLGAMIAEIRTLVEEDRSEETLAEARADLAPLAELVAGWLDRHATRSMEAEALRRLVADAYRLCGRHEEALAHYEALLREEPNVLPLLAGKADCLFHRGGDDLAEAMRIYRRIAAAGAGEGDARAEHFWLAQLRMLQILDATQRNTHQILPRIRRLRQQDEGLGGRHLRRQFLRLENKYTGGGA